MGIFIKSGILHTLKFHLHTLSCHFWLNLWNDITPLLTLWSYVFLALTHRFDLVMTWCCQLPNHNLIECWRRSFGWPGWLSSVQGGLFVVLSFFFSKYIPWIPNSSSIKKRYRSSFLHSKFDLCSHFTAAMLCAPLWCIRDSVLFTNFSLITWTNESMLCISLW